MKLGMEELDPGMSRQEKLREPCLSPGWREAEGMPSPGRASSGSLTSLRELMTVELICQG